VHVPPFKPTLKAPGTKRLKLRHDHLLSSFAFNSNLRRYTLDPPPKPEVWKHALASLPFYPRDAKTGYNVAQAGGSLRTSTRLTVNLLLLLLQSYIPAFTLKVAHAPISIRVLVRNGPPASTLKVRHAPISVRVLVRKDSPVRGCR
jgi:hypothetical protein